MKKDIEWLVKMINEERDRLRQRIESGEETPNQKTFDEGRGWALSHVLRMMYNLDEPEALSKEFPEKVVVPQFVADEFDYNKNPYWEVDESKDVSHILRCAFGNKGKPSEFLDWVRENPKDYVMAVRNGYEVEEEQKYCVNDGRNILLCKWKSPDGWKVISTVESANHSLPFAELDFRLTEHEIKEYDPRYWEFRKSDDVEF